MWGSKLFKILSGSREQVGYKAMDLPVPSGGIIPKGTWVDDYVDGNGVAYDTTGVLASGGFAVGFITNDVDEHGMEGLQAFQNMIIGKHDNPVKNGLEVAVAKPSLGAELEYEGKGTAGPGNLVCTSGTGAISTATARKTLLGFHNGSLRVAQSSEFAHFALMDAKVTPEVDPSNVRVRVEYIGPTKVA